MHEQNIFYRRIQWQLGLIVVVAGNADKVDFPASNDALFVDQPPSAAGVKTFMNRRKRNFAPVIVVARHAEHRRGDARQNFKRFGEKLFLFHNVAGKTDEIR